MKHLLKNKLTALKNHKDKNVSKIANQLYLLVDVSEGKQFKEILNQKNDGNGELSKFALYFDNLSAVNNYGIASIIEKYKKSELYNINENFKSLVDNYDISLSMNTPEYRIIDSFVDNFKKYKNVNENSYHTISQKKDKYKAYELLANTIHILENDNNSDLYQDIITHLNGGFELPASHVKGFVFGALMNKTHLHPILETAIEAFKALDVTTQCKLQYVTNAHGTVKLTHRTTAVMESSKLGKVFYANNNLYSVKNKKIKLLEQDDIKKFISSEKDGKRFLSLCQSLSAGKINENEIAFFNQKNESTYKLKHVDGKLQLFIDDKAKSDNKQKIVESVNFGGDQFISSVISNILDNSDFLKQLTDVATYITDYNNVQIDTCGTPDIICVVICDPDNGIQGEVVEGEPEEIKSDIEKEYDINIDDENMEVNEDETTDEELQNELNIHTENLKITEENLEKIAALDDDTQKEADIVKLKAELEEEKEKLVGLIADIQNKIDGKNDGVNEDENNNDEIIKGIIDQLQKLLDNAGSDGEENGEIEGEPIKVGESILHPFVSFNKVGFNLNKKCFIGIESTKKVLKRIVENKDIENVEGSENVIDIKNLEEDIENMVDSLTQQDIVDDDSVVDDIEKGSPVIEGKGWSFDQLKNYKIVGNFNADRKFFDAAVEFIKDDKNSVENRYDIVVKYDAGMDFETPKGDKKQIVDTFIEDIDESVFEKDYSDETRDEYAKKGWALEDGSFPIANVSDLEDAIHMTGLAKDPEKAKEHIIKRAKELGAEDMIPDTW